MYIQQRWNFSLNKEYQLKVCIGFTRIERKPSDHVRNYGAEGFLKLFAFC